MLSNDRVLQRGGGPGPRDHHSRPGRDGRASLRTWLYRIATNLCLDVRKSAARRTLPFSVMTPIGGDGGDQVDLSDVGWIQPIPERVVDEVPEDIVVARETIELAFIAAIQDLPSRQRAVFIVRDVLGWSTADAAIICDIAETAVKSALQRARSNLRGSVPMDRTEWQTREISEAEKAVLDRYLTAHATGTPDDLAAVLREDLRVAYPQIPMWIDSRDAFITGTRDYALPGDYRFVPFAANRQPALAIYLRPPGERIFSLVAMELLRIVDNQVVEVVDFALPDLAPHFGLEVTLAD